MPKAAQQVTVKKERSAAQIAATARMLEARRAKMLETEGGAKGGAASTTTRTKNVSTHKARSGTKEGGSKGGAVAERVPVSSGSAPLGIGRTSNVDPDTQWYTNLGGIYTELSGLTQLTQIAMQAAGAGNAQLANQHQTTIYQRIFELSKNLMGTTKNTRLT